jgi:2,4-dienoyl-CoA reductase-like NADH-dependent reductase (Old Yellow Enzyme family)
MWKPPDRIKHTLLDSRWPTADQAAKSKLFTPISLVNGIALRERTWVPAMVPWRATEDGDVTPEVLEWYGRFAEGQPGAIVVEATGVRDIPSGPLLRIGDDRFLDGLTQIADVVHERSGGRTRIFIQLIDFLRIRRRPQRERYLRSFLSITDDHRQRLAVVLEDRRWLTQSEESVRTCLVDADEVMVQTVLTSREWEALQFGARERVTDTEKAHIAALPHTLPPLFASAAKRAQQAGFDGVELHYAHAYTMASFLSRLNTRQDGYGGSREHRLRLPLEVYQAVREAVGDGYPVGCRFLCDEIIDGGNDVDDAVAFGLAFAQAGMDFLSLSTGGKFEDAKQPKEGKAAYPYTGRSGYECMPTKISDQRGPFARNVPKQAQIRQRIRAAGLETPVVVAGGICTFEQAEGILVRGEGDIVAAARQSLADPDWFLKMRLGRGDDVVRCEYTNYCEALDQQHKAVTCRLWDRKHLDESGLRKTSDGRRTVAPRWRP